MLSGEMRENCSVLNTWKKKCDCLQQKGECSSSKKGVSDPSWGCRTIMGWAMLGCTEALREMLMLFTCPGAIFWQKGLCLFYHAALLTSDTENGQNCADAGRRGSWKYDCLSLLSRWKSSSWSCYTLAVEAEPGRCWLLVLNNLHPLLL